MLSVLPARRGRPAVGECRLVVGCLGCDSSLTSGAKLHVWAVGFVAGSTRVPARSARGQWHAGCQARTGSKEGGNDALLCDYLLRRGGGVAAALGMRGVAGMSANIGYTLVGVALIFLVISLVFGGIPRAVPYAITLRKERDQLRNTRGGQRHAGQGAVPRCDWAHRHALHLKPYHPQVKSAVVAPGEVARCAWPPPSVKSVRLG